jgi:hypothetical protein
MKNVLRWWIVFCSLAGAIGYSYYTGGLQKLVASDESHLAIGLVGVLVVAVVAMGFRFHAANMEVRGRLGAKLDPAEDDIDWYHLLYELFTMVGIVGTVIGGISMFRGIQDALVQSHDKTEAFNGIAVAVAAGLGTSFYATLVGLSGAIVLKVLCQMYHGAFHEKA